MMSKVIFQILTVFLIVTVLPAGAVAAALSVSGVLQGRNLWSGEVILAGPVLVPEGAQLLIDAGARVRPLRADAGIRVEGSFEILGNEASPVRFTAQPDWKGIELVAAGAHSRVQHAFFEGAAVALDVQGATLILKSSRFTGCGTAIKLLRQATATVERCRFERNGIGIDGEMRSEVLVRGCEFKGHSTAGILFAHNNSGEVVGSLFQDNEQGIRFQRFFTGELRGNRFVSNRVGVFCDQTRNSPNILGNRFEKNQKALNNTLFSSPSVRNNEFIGNEVALSNDQQGRPEVVHNLFLRNGVAMENRRRSAARIEKNIFKQNRLALLCDFSSYPVVRLNNFLGNPLAVRLGVGQSADWEKRVGSSAQVAQQVRSVSGRTPQADLGQLGGADFVDVTGNWWGEDTSKLHAVGDLGNLDMFHDGQDQKRVDSTDHGPVSYKVDLVRFKPWLDKPVADAGPVVSSAEDERRALGIQQRGKENHQ